MGKVKFGFKNVHVAKITEEEGVITYGTPFAVPGGVNFTADPEGETNPFYADDIAYYTTTAKNGYTGSLEIADVPEKFLTDILGQTKDTNGAIIENSGDKESRFALMCEVDGDPSKRRVVFYDCLATRPAIEYSTKEENVEVKTATMDLTIKPRSTDGQVKATLTLTEENTTIYNAFFTKVYEKDAEAGV